jgi:hypothetical protein
MRDADVVESVTRGLYRLASLEPLSHPDLVTVATRVPQGVLCFISALSFHELTTQVPHAFDVALERGTRKPRLDSTTRRRASSGFRDPRSMRISTRASSMVRAFAYRTRRRPSSTASGTGTSSAWTLFWRR